MIKKQQVAVLPFTSCQIKVRLLGKRDAPMKSQCMSMSHPWREKIDVAKRFQLQGISLWRLGLVTEAMWTAMRQSIAGR